MKIEWSPSLYYFQAKGFQMKREQTTRYTRIMSMMS